MCPRRNTIRVSAKGKSHMSVHYVYRLYDRDDALLYVGCTRDVEERMSQHKWTAPWIAEVDRCESDSYPTKAEALAVERAAIISLRPRHNQTHNLERNEVAGPILTAKDIAARWNMAVESVLRMHKRGEIPAAFNAHAVKRSYRWHLATIEAFERQDAAS